MYKAVLFDLDGTLLPLDQDYFVETYFARLAAFLEPYGYEPKALIHAIYKASDAMAQNNGFVNNEQLFWDSFESSLGEGKRADAVYFERFYTTDFENVKEVTGFDSRAREIVSRLHDSGVITILATNPMFPRVATEARMGWAGLTPDIFDLVTTYDNSCFCKPNPAYYLDILRRFDLKPDECAMVGNDVGDDMVAETIGMHVFLHTDRLVNRTGADISHYPQGGLAELAGFLGVELA